MDVQAPAALVTGATSGIGFETALGLARAGFRVLLHGRTPERAEEACGRLAGKAPGCRVEPMAADLASLEAVRGLARAVGARTDVLAVLVNNAGLFRRRREASADGYEMMLAVNHLAPFLLTRELLALLRRGGAARIVNVGSAASDRARIDLDDPHSTRRPGLFGMTAAYGQSKLMLMTATFEWARRLDGTGIMANVVHPGLVATKIAQRGGVAGLAWRIAKPFMLSPEKGAQASLHVATAPDLAGVTGRYFKRKREAAPNPLALDGDLAARVWRLSEELVAEASPAGGSAATTNAPLIARSCCIGAATPGAAD